MEYNLTGIEIDNFLSFKNAKISGLKNYNVLIGKNNAGKSNLFKVLLEIRSVLEGHNFNHKILYEGNKNNYASISLTFEFPRDFKVNLLKNLFSSKYLNEVIKSNVECPNSDEDSIIDCIIDQGYFKSIKIKFAFNNEFEVTLILESLSLIHKENIEQYIYTTKKENGGYFVWTATNDQSLLRKIIDINNFIKVDLLRNINNNFSGEDLNNFMRHFKNLGFPWVKESRLLYEIAPNFLEFFHDLFQYIPANRSFPKKVGIDDADSAKLQENGQDLVKYIFKQENIGIGKKWMEELNEELKDFYPITYLSQKFSNRQSEVYYLEDGLNMEIDDKNMGSAFLHMVFLLGFLKNMEDNKILLIEEPELFIFPGLQKKILKKFIKISNKFQIFITTHSPGFLSRRNDKCAIIHVKKEESFSELKKISEDEIIEVLNDLDLSLYDYLLYNGILFVEGIDDLVILDTINYAIFEPTFKIIPCEGKKKFSYYATSKILRTLINNQLSYLFILDLDRGNEQIWNNIEDINFRKDLEGHTIRLFSYEIENIIIQPILIIDYLFCNKKTNDVINDFNWLSSEINNSFIEMGQNYTDFILKKFIDKYFPYFSKEDMNKLLIPTSTVQKHEDLYKIWIKLIESLSLEKDPFCKNKELDKDNMTLILENFHKEYMSKFGSRKYNEIISGKIIFNSLKEKLSHRFRLSEAISLDKLALHLTKFLSDYIIFETKQSPHEKLEIKENNESILISSTNVDEFRSYCFKIKKLVLGIKDKLNLKFQENFANFDQLKFEYIYEFLLEKWNLIN